MFEGQPKGLWTLALANTGERFGYYTMLAVFVLFLQANFGFAEGITSTIFSSFLMLVYFLPLFGGMLADKFGFNKMVTIGIFIMFSGYVLLSIPLGSNSVAMIAMAAALILVSAGTGLFKGNLQVMVGDLYNEEKYAAKRDSGFSLFYMAINIGAMFAPTAAIKIMEWAQTSLGVSEADSYHFAFAVAFLSLIFSIAVYYIGKPTFKHVIVKKAPKAEATATTETKSETKEDASDTKERIVCLCLVFAVVIFFWMAFHQNGLTLTFFARDYTATTSTGIESMMFDVWNLVACIFVVYGLFAIFQGKDVKEKVFGSAFVIIPLVFMFLKYTEIAPIFTVIVVIVMGMIILFSNSKSATNKCLQIALLLFPVIFLVYRYLNIPESTKIDAPIFQQFNACFVVMLTPVSVALFGWLGRKGKEPKAPVKIGLGMLVAASAYLLMTMGSLGLPTPAYNADGSNMHMADATPNLLVGTYLVLTFAELLLSPIGISFVSKVAPEKYKGMMMGGWFVSTALGNFLVQIPGYLWGMDLTVVWGVLMVICLVAALFIFSIIKKLNKVA